MHSTGSIANRELEKSKCTQENRKKLTGFLDSFKNFRISKKKDDVKAI